jgi:hypothetical protein
LNRPPRQIRIRCHGKTLSEMIDRADVTNTTAVIVSSQIVSVRS